MPLNLAILEADTPMPGTLSRIGPYTTIFTTLLAAAAAAAATSPSLLTITRYNIHDNPTTYPSLSTLDALLITGSKHNAMDNDEWIIKLVAFTKTAMDAGKKVVGVCFGHQIVGRALGQPVKRSEEGWEVSVTPVNVTEEGRRIFGIKGDKMNVFQMHRDYVEGLPENARSLASSPLCPVQGFYIPSKCITVQGHPEFTPEIVSEILDTRFKAGVWDEAFYEDAKKRLGEKHDGVKIAQGFIKFLMGEL